MLVKLRRSIKRCVALLGVLLILALMMVPVFADSEETPAVTTDSDGNIVSVPVYFSVSANDTYNGVRYDDSGLVFLGNFGAGDIIQIADYSKPGYHVTSYHLMAWFLNNDIDDLYYSNIDNIIVNAAWLRVMDNAVGSGGIVASGMRIIIYPETDFGSDDEYHSAAFIRVINALWQNFYDTFISLTTQMNFFGISVLSVLSILVTVFVVVTVVKLFHGGG